MSTIAANVLANIDKSKQANVDTIVDNVHRNLGMSATVPTTRLNGAALQLGDQYTNIVDGLEYKHTGSIWVSTDTASLSVSSGATKVGAVLPDGSAGTAQQAIDAAVNIERQFGNYAALRAYTGPSLVASVNGRANVFDGAGGIFVRDVSDNTSIDNDITLLRDGSGRRWKRQWKGSVNVLWAGAKCDKVTDDTAAVQKAIDFCKTFASWPSLEVPGPCLLTASVMIDRRVDTNDTTFRIFGSCQSGGFHVTTNINMFDSTYAMTLNPQSEWISFENLNFTCDVYTTAPRVLTGNFLRIKFLNCNFNRVRCVIASSYLQSWYFDHCTVRLWESVFIVASHGFDMRFTGVTSEFGYGYLVNFANGCYGVSFIGGCHEGSVGGLISTGNVQSLYIGGAYYIEQNNQPGIELNMGTPNKSVTLDGIFLSSTATNIANPNYWEISCGNTSELVATGVYSYDGRVFDNSLLPSTATSTPRMKASGCGTALGLAGLAKKPVFLDSGLGTWTLTNTLGTGTATNVTYRRSGNIMHLEGIFVFSGTSGTTNKMLGLPIQSVSPFISGRVIYSDLVGEINIIGGDAGGNGNTSLSFSFCKDKQATAYTYTELAGKTIAFSIELSI